MREVTSFSISGGEGARAIVLIWTWLLVMSGTGVDRHFGQGPRAKRHHREAKQHDEPAMFDRKGEDAADHRDALVISFALFPSSALRMKLFVTANFSPIDKPERISIAWSSSWPSVTFPPLESFGRANKHHAPRL